MMKKDWLGAQSDKGGWKDRGRGLKREELVQDGVESLVGFL